MILYFVDVFAWKQIQNLHESSAFVTWQTISSIASVTTSTSVPCGNKLLLIQLMEREKVPQRVKEYLSHIENLRQEVRVHSTSDNWEDYTSQLSAVCMDKDW